MTNVRGKCTNMILRSSSCRRDKTGREYTLRNDITHTNPIDTIIEYSVQVSNINLSIEQIHK